MSSDPWPPPPEPSERGPSGRRWLRIAGIVLGVVLAVTGLVAVAFVIAFVVAMNSWAANK